MSLRIQKSALVMAGIALLSIGGTTAVQAGPHYSVPGVVISRNADGSGYAEGTLGGTRNTANRVERLSCTVKRSEVVDASGNVSRTATTVSCSARTANNETASCISPSDAIGNQLNGVSGDSLVTFYFNKLGICTNINVYSSTSLERKAP